MIEREYADIDIFLGSEVIDTVLITASSRRVRKLMESDYIELAFKKDEPVEYPLGCYAEDEIFGKFYITEEQAPSFNKSLHGYDYKLKFDAHYYRWQKHFVCMMRGEKRVEKVWTITTSLRNQMREFMKNLQCLGYVGSTIDFSDDNTLNAYVVIDESVETEMQSLTMSYASTYMLDALKTMAETWKCEYWIEGNEESFKIHFGTCENGTEQIISLDEYTDNGETVAANAESMSFDKDMSGGKANLLYYFGGTENIPNTYRKELKLTMGDVYGRYFNGYKDGEMLDIRGLLDNPTHKVEIEMPNITIGSGTYCPTESAVTNESLIYTKFREQQTGYADKTLRYMKGIRVCGAVKVTIGGEDKIIKILSAEDLAYVNTGTIKEVRVIAELVITEYIDGVWQVVDYMPVNLTHREWYDLTINNSPLSGYLYQNEGQYITNGDFVFWGYYFEDTGQKIKVNMPSGAQSSSYLVNTDSITQFLSFNAYVSVVLGYNVCNLYNLFTNNNGVTRVTTSKRINLFLVITKIYNGETITQSIGSETDLGACLRPQAVDVGTDVTFKISSSQSLIKLEWDKIFNDNDSLLKVDDNYYLRLLASEDFPLEFSNDMKSCECTVAWNEARFNDIREYYDESDEKYHYIITRELPRRNYTIAFFDTVWVTRYGNAIFKYSSNSIIGFSDTNLITTIDTSGGAVGARNLFAHRNVVVDKQYSNDNAYFNFCPDVERYAAYSRADFSIGAQTLYFTVSWKRESGAAHFKTATIELRLYISFSAVPMNYGTYNYDYIINSTSEPRGNSVCLLVAADDVTFTTSDVGTDEDFTMPINIGGSTYVFDDESFWNAINNQNYGLLPKVTVMAHIGYKDEEGRRVNDSKLKITDITLDNPDDFIFNVYYYSRKIEAYINSSNFELPHLQMANQIVPVENGTEFVIISDYDYKVPYKWFTSDLDNPSSLLSIGDMHLQLPRMDYNKFLLFEEIYGLKWVHIEGEEYIVKGDPYKPTEDTTAQGGKTYYADANGTPLDTQPTAGTDISTRGYYELDYDVPAYKDGCIFSLGMIEEPDKYFPDEKCVINEAIYPMAIMLIMRQDNTNFKGIFTENKKWYQEVEGESSADRPSFPWLQYHVNIGVPKKEGTTTTIEEIEFNKDYILQNSQPLKMRFLVPNDVKDLVASDVMSLLEDNAHCKLAGMKFEVAFNDSITYESNEVGSQTHTQDYAIARNEDFGAKLPSDILCPSNLDPCVLENWNVKTLSAMGLIDKAEYRLLDKAFEYYKAMHDNNFTITADMMSDWDVTPEIGTKVNVRHASLKNGEKHTRILGYELKLDKPYDTPKLTIGESEATSRLKVLEKELTKLS